MSFSIGLDIGGSKIAGAVFDENGHMHALNAMPTPGHYADFLAACGTLIEQLDKACGYRASVGIGIAGMIDRERGTVFAPNIPCLKDRLFRADLEKTCGRPARIGNDADCAALAEAIDGAGHGHRSVFALIMGTGVGGGLAIDGKIHEGAHGLTGEIGHLPLPFRDASDGPMQECGCGQVGCIDKTISGPALARLYEAMTGKDAGGAHKVAGLAEQGDAEARRVLDQFYTTVAKAMTVVIHSFDPQIIVVGGGLAGLPGLYEEVPKRWERYVLCKTLRTRFVPAKFGATSGIRGAAKL